MRKTTPTQGRADLARLRRLSDREIARTSPDELRELPDDFWQGARVVTPVAKEAISIRLDSDVIAYFRATGPRYQTRINAVLRSYVDQVREAAPPARR
ncbi:MAG: BrnA antitoxin family protein [Gemmatimonadaceae bacterium]